MSPTGEPGGSLDRLVLFRLDALSNDLQRVEEKIEVILIDVAMLKVKAGVWGAIGGLMAAAVIVVPMVVTH